MVIDKNSGKMSLPEGTTELIHQVAGHYHEANKSLLGILRHHDGSVLKPSYEDERGTREREFYCKVFGNDVNETDQILRTFLPKYLGIFRTSYKDKEVSFIKLEDLTRKFHKPCILDVKICPRGNHRKIGFRIVGSRVYYEQKGSYLHRTKEYYKALDSHNAISNALSAFFFACHNMDEFIKILLEKLQLIENWFKRQKSYSFNSSSLLVVYEGCKKIQDKDRDEQNKLELRMIDFAHVFPSSEMDSNYLLGLTNFIQCLENLSNS